MKKTLIILAACGLFACNDSAKDEIKTEMKDASTETSAVKSKVLPDAENQLMRDGIKAYADGNVDAFLATMADSVKIYYPGPGDSLVGKDAIRKFFKTRQDSVSSASMVDPVFLAVDAQDLAQNVMPGKWLMAWYRWDIKYKNGKTANFPIQVTQHVNADGKVDFGVWYYDVARAFGR